MRRPMPHQHEAPEVLTLTEIFRQVSIPIFNIGLAFSLFAALEYEVGILPGMEEQMSVLMSAGILTMIVAACILYFLFDDGNERLTTMIRMLGFSLHTISFVVSWIILLSEDIEKSWFPLLPALALLPIGTSICFRETSPHGLVCLMHLILGGYYSTLLVNYDVGVFGLFDVETHNTIYPRLVQNRFYVVGTGFSIIAHGIFMVILKIIMKDGDGPVFSFTDIVRGIYELFVASFKLFLWVLVSIYELITKKQRTQARQQKLKEARLRHILEEQAKAKAVLEQAYPTNMRRKSRSDEQPKPVTSQTLAEADSSDEDERDQMTTPSSGMITPEKHHQAISSSESSPELKEPSPKIEESPEPKQLQMITRSRMKETKTQSEDPEEDIRVSEERSHVPKQKKKRKSKGRSCKK